MKKSEYYSLLIEDSRNKLIALQEKIELLKKYKVENINELITIIQESKLNEEISDLENKKM